MKLVLKERAREVLRWMELLLYRVHWRTLILAVAVVGWHLLLN
jgi:hypothetical protein